MCLPPYACFPPHFHESGNEHLSLLPAFLSIHGHATLLLPPFLSRSVSSSVFHSKNVGCLNLLWSAAVAESPPKAARGPKNSLTNHDSLRFPTWSHWLGDRLPVCSRLVLRVVRIPFVVFLLDVQLFCADFGRLSAKTVWRITFSKEAGWESSLDLFLDGCTDGSQCAGAQTQPCPSTTCWLAQAELCYVVESCW